jgi:hypothetical protein
VLQAWDGTFSVLWRKRVARHVDNCALCSARHRSIPQHVLTGTFAALPFTFLLPPSWVRDRVVDDAVFANGPEGRTTRRGRRWRSDGFPPGDEARRRGLVAIISALVAVLVLALLVGTGALASDDEPSVDIARQVPVSTTNHGSSARVAPTTDPTAPELAIGPTDQQPTPTTKAPGKSTVPTTAPVASAPTSPPDVSGPSLSVNVPSQIAASAQCVGPTLGSDVSATAADPSGITQVISRYTGAAVGTFALDKLGATSWKKFWKPPAVGFYTLTITATDGVGNTTSAVRSVEGYDIIC